MTGKESWESLLVNGQPGQGPLGELTPMLVPGKQKVNKNLPLFAKTEGPGSECCLFRNWNKLHLFQKQKKTCPYF
jgi:hypothetical protein